MASILVIEALQLLVESCRGLGIPKDAALTPIHASHRIPSLILHHSTFEIQREFLCIIVAVHQCCDTVVAKSSGDTIPSCLGEFRKSWRGQALRLMAIRQARMERVALIASCHKRMVSGWAAVSGKGTAGFVRKNRLARRILR